jgi:hypothetical protein|uniref:Uncharacterized protein n=1 Tax=Zea mays TaxID=4577 RepID=A0A804QA60_MAIZE
MPNVTSNDYRLEQSTWNISTIFRICPKEMKHCLNGCSTTYMLYSTSGACSFIHNFLLMIEVHFINLGLNILKQNALKGHMDQIKYYREQSIFFVMSLAKKRCFFERKQCKWKT